MSLSRVSIFLLLGFCLVTACSPGDGGYGLNISFPDETAREATRSVALWVAQPGVYSCEELTADFIDPDEAMTVRASAVIGVVGAQVLPEVPAGRFQFIAEARNSDGAPILRGCSEAVVEEGEDLEVSIALVWVCSAANEGQACRANAHCLSGECRCDAGTFGADCQPCPGGMDAPCSGHGVCDEGPEGDGTCACDAGWDGVDCSGCAEGFHDGGCGVCVGEEAGLFGGGSGTREDPYWICTIEQLQAIAADAALWSSSFLLQRDLDLSGLDWAPIGTADLPFAGEFDGGGYELSHLRINLPEQDYVGLFGQVHFGGVHDLNLSDCRVVGHNYVGCLAGLLWGPSTAGSLSAQGEVSGAQYVGGLIGVVSDMEMSDLRADCQVTAEQYSGGLIGYFNTYLLRETTLLNSSAGGTVTSTGSFDYAGGLVGYLRGPTYMDGCNSQARVVGERSVGGLVGAAYELSLKNCWANGDVTTGQGFGMGSGGLVGELYDSSLADCWASGDVGDGEGFGLGGLVGSMDDSSITACHAEGDVSGSFSVGGLVASGSGMNISRSWAAGRVTCTGSQAGGLVSRLNGSLSNCYARGPVHASADTAGGLVGVLESGSVDRCYSSGMVTGGADLGGLIGLDDSAGSAVLSYAYWDVDTSFQANSAGGEGHSSEEMKMQSTYDGFLFPDDWILPPGSYPELVDQEPLVIHSLSLEESDVAGGFLLEIQASGFSAGASVSAVCDPATVSAVATDRLQCTVAPSDYPDRVALYLINPDGRTSNRVWFQYTCAWDLFSGSGTEADPYRIEQPEQLARIACFPDAHFLLTGDLDMSEAGVPAAPYNDFAHPFTGTLDGDGHRIVNLRVDMAKTGLSLGLFGQLQEGAVVRDLVLESPTVEGVAAEDMSLAGVLAGSAVSSLIENVHVSGDWLVEAGVDIDAIGGLLGGASSTIMRDCSVSGRVGSSEGMFNFVAGLSGTSYEGLVERCSFDGEVVGSQNAAGLVGRCMNGEGIRESRASGIVRGRSQVGGLVSDLQAPLRDSYAQVDVSCGDETYNFAGGLVGSCCLGEVVRVWWSGSLTGANVGGILGRSTCDEMLVQDAFWDVEVSGVGSDGQLDDWGGLGYSTQHMQQEASFPNFDFENVWRIDEGADYPRLR